MVAMTLACSSEAPEPVVAPEPEPEPPLVLGWLAFEAGELNSAATQFRAAIDDDPSDAQPQLGLGFALLRLGALSQAIVHFDRASSLGDRSASPHAGRCVAFRDLEPLAPLSAIAAADSALAVDPGWSFTHDTELDFRDLQLIRAESHFALTDYEQARLELEALGGRSLDPESPDLIAELLAELTRLSVLIGGRRPPVASHGARR